MAEAKSNPLSIGSLWHRWDPHLHTPGTLFADEFKGDWDAYFDALNASKPPIRAVGLTDYFGLSGYLEAIQRKKEGKLPGVELLFPNVELRLNIKTASNQAINVHLLFSPTPADHVEQIERLLGELSFEFQETTYRCSEKSLAALGRAFSKESVPDDKSAIRVGAQQFKASIQDIRRLLRDPWAQANCLLGVSGNTNDGTSGLQTDDSFKALRIEIERLADVVFSSTPGQRDFWLGRGKATKDEIEKSYGRVKPCLHGSDAHAVSKVGNPVLNRYCWIKGDLTFEALRQAAIEPEERTWIGDKPPIYSSDAFAVTELRTNGTPWLKHKLIPLNRGLVAIIGSRGSGKTALVDMLAAGTGATSATLPESSFLSRASQPTNYLSGASVDLNWANGDTSSFSLDPQEWTDENPTPEANYLSQQFVDRLCSTSGLASELRREIERVVFEAIDPTDRLESDNFVELSSLVTQPILARQADIRTTIESASSQIAKEDIAKHGLSSLVAQRDELTGQIAKLKSAQTDLIPKDKEAHAKALSEIESAWKAVSSKIEAASLRKQKLTDLREFVSNYRATREPSQWQQIQQTFAGAGLSDESWKAFRTVFTGNVDQILSDSIQRVDVEILRLRAGGAEQHEQSLELQPLSVLTAKMKDAQATVGVDGTNQKKYQDLQKSITTEDAKLRRVVTAITHAEGAEARRLELVQQRRHNYAAVFDAFQEQELSLKKLYAPLMRELEGATGALSKLAVVVQRRVDIDSWATTGEQFVDLRTASKLRGKGRLREEAEKLLLPAWKEGTSSDVATAMETFRENFQSDLVSALPKNLTVAERSSLTQEIAAWLYSTSHIEVTYGISFDGVSIESLSPGTRGIVLLLLYLAIDKRDQRPLVIDQPEENLDPRSIYDELVPYFREARRRRQIILVTHNANLVVNTDADQVIVAKAVRTRLKGLPDISYRSGGLEDPFIRSDVCSVLEGGSRAFLDRERRYRLRFSELGSTIDESLA